MGGWLPNTPAVLLCLDQVFRSPHVACITHPHCRGKGIPAAEVRISPQPVTAELLLTSTRLNRSMAEAIVNALAAGGFLDTVRLVCMVLCIHSPSKWVGTRHVGAPVAAEGRLHSVPFQPPERLLHACPFCHRAATCGRTRAKGRRRGRRRCCLCWAARAGRALPRMWARYAIRTRAVVAMLCSALPCCKLACMV